MIDNFVPNLRNNPNIALLDLLRASLELAEHALLVAHPGYVDEDPAVERPGCIEHAYLDGILFQLHALEKTLRTYRTFLEQRPSEATSDHPF